MTIARALPIAVMAAIVPAFSFLVLEEPAALLSCLLGWTMLAIAVSDMNRFIVPDVLSLPAIPAGLIANGWLEGGSVASPIALPYLTAAVVGAGSLYLIRALYGHWRKREGLGLGDVKLGAVAGSWTGLEGLSPTLLLACTLGIAYVFLSRSRGPVSASTAIPFGAVLAPAIWIIWCAARIP